jgi:DNA-binding MarR family transcriptional regulator
MELGQLMDAITLQMRLLRAAEEADTSLEELTERESLMLELLNERGKMSISDVSSYFARVASSTISVTLTRLWRDKGLISKTVDPSNQRVTMVELTDKGIDTVAQIKRGRAERFRILIEALGLNDQEREVLKSIITRAVGHMHELL